MTNKYQFRIKSYAEWKFVAHLLKSQGFKWKDSGLSPLAVPFARVINGNRQVIIHVDVDNKTLDRGYNFDAFAGSIISRAHMVKRLRALEGGLLNENIGSFTGDSTGGSTDND